MFVSLVVPSEIALVGSVVARFFFGLSALVGHFTAFQVS